MAKSFDEKNNHLEEAEKLSDNGGLERLRKLTDDIFSFPQSTDVKSGYKEYKMNKGHSFGSNLLNRREISCADWFASADCVFPEHQHIEKEWLIIYSGTLFLTIDGKEEKLGVGDSKVIEKNVKHSARFTEDCWHLAIVIPRSDDWPS
jgi:quercetin dioxygenase-like cupin family protein